MKKWSLVFVLAFLMIGLLTGVAMAEYTGDLCTDSSKAISSSSMVERPATAAFDNVLSGGYGYAWCSQEATLPQWVGYHFETGKVIQRYTLAPFAPHGPKTWVFQGSNNGVNYTNLDMHTDVAEWSGLRTFDVANTNSYTYYRVLVQDTHYSPNYYALIYEIEMMEQVQAVLTAPTNLSATMGDAQVNLTWNAVSGATTYNIKRADISGGTYTTVGTSTTASYSNTGLTNGTTYYYVVTAVNSAGESQPSTEASATPQSEPVTLPSIDITCSETASIGNNVTTQLVVKDAVNICALDVKVTYDTTVFDFVYGQAKPGYKVYSSVEISPGLLRYVVAAQGQQYAINGEKAVMNLVFRPKKAGDGKIDIVSARMADNATLEFDVAAGLCGEEVINVAGVFSDVNRSGSFTLLDLAINGWYFGKPASETDNTKYDADIVANGQIDDDDLVAIVAQVLANTEYPPNAV